MADGIDVYNGNGQVDWGAVKASGCKLGIAKATEGNYYQDASLAENIDGIRSNGLRAGTYHFVRPDVVHDANAEAHYYYNFVMMRTQIHDDELCCLDYENYQGQPWPLSSQDTVSYAKVWLDTVSNLTGRPAVLYANLSMLRTMNWDTSLEMYPLWFAGDRPDLVEFPIFLQQNGYVDIGGHSYDADYFGPAYTENQPKEDDMAEVYWRSKDSNPPDGRVWQIAGNSKRWVSATEWQFLLDITAFLKLPAPVIGDVPEAILNGYPDVATFSATGSGEGTHTISGIFSGTTS